MLTDPFFSPAGTSFPITDEFAPTVHQDPAFRLDQLPVIDAVLLSHEDHADNLDPLGRQLLGGRRVFTTLDGAKNLSRRPAVLGMTPWQKANVMIAGKAFQIIATPTKHTDGQECTGFLITADDFGTGRDGLPNAIYFSGDTVYVPELARIASDFHVRAAILNLGNAYAPKEVGNPDSPLYQITMDGRSAARLFREVKADALLPMHYEAWEHFTQSGNELRRVFEEEGIADKVCWLTSGKAVTVS